MGDSIVDARQFLVGGDWLDPAGTERVDIQNPADLSLVGRAILGNAADADRAVEAARGAFESWQFSPVIQRIALLKRMRAAYLDISEDMERHLVREIGITTMVAGGQTRMTLSHFDGVLEFLADYPFTTWQGQNIELVREPVGVVAAITSWNAPVNQMLCKAVPAIAAACTVVVKPSEQAPLCGHLLAQAMARAEIPPGVFNLIQGRGHDCGRRLAEHPDVDMVSITGSVSGGGAIAQAAAPTVKRIHQELGGKSPNIILPDADLAEAVGKGVLICMMAAGQACAAPTRMIVPEESFEEVAKLAIAAANALVVGPPDQPGVHFGPLANAAQFDRVNALIEEAIAEGQPLLCGGTRRPTGLATGYYVRPTIFGPVAADAAIAQQEVFGPVLCIQTYRDLDEAVAIANATDFGLAAYIESADVASARLLGRRIRAGYVNVNYPMWSAAAPFGGFRRSGNGKQYGVWGFEEFLDTKAIVQ